MTLIPAPSAAATKLVNSTKAASRVLALLIKGLTWKKFLTE